MKQRCCGSLLMRSAAKWTNSGGNCLHNHLSQGTCLLPASIHSRCIRIVKRAVTESQNSSSHNKTRFHSNQKPEAQLRSRAVMQPLLLKLN